MSGLKDICSVRRKVEGKSRGRLDRFKELKNFHL
jgi:hypothetical protein